MGRYEIIEAETKAPAAPLDGGWGVAVGFSGTRKGMTEEQREAVKRVLTELKPRPLFFHHGCCLGADAQANRIARELEIMTVGHPPTNRSGVDEDIQLDFVLPPAPWLTRNLRIVERCEFLIATPRSKVEQKRGSGTWHVIRHAPRNNKPILIIYPDGDFELRDEHGKVSL